jgi:tetratricopeptide (TPR) repeat protein
MAALDDLARRLLHNDDVRRLADHVDDWLTLDLSGHPLVALAAAAACHGVHHGDPRADGLVAAAWEELVDAGDDQALGWAANIRADLAFGRGELEQALHWWRRSLELLREETPAGYHVLAHLSMDAFFAGDLGSAIRRADAARADAARADAARTGDAYELIPLTYLAAYTQWTGDLARCERWLDRAEARCRPEVASRPRDMEVLVHALRGAVHSQRGAVVDADRAFGRALVLAQELAIPWYAMVARVMRAQSMAEFVPGRSVEDARRARRDAVALRDDWWEARATLAEGIAWRTLDPDRSVSEIQASLRRLTVPLERARAQLALGETYLWQDRGRVALAPLLMARVAFKRAGAWWYEARACARLGEADPRSAEGWFEPARREAAVEPAYGRLLTGVRPLGIDLVDRRGVTIGGRRVAFLTRHAELAVYLLASAGPEGLDADSLAEVLWPAASRTRRAPRLRTALWQVRTAIGPHAWRVGRRGRAVVLDLTGVDLTGVDLTGVELTGDVGEVREVAPEATPPTGAPPARLAGAG